MDDLAGRHETEARRRDHAAAQEDVMAMIKASLAGAAIGALTLATIMLVAPIAAQAPGGPSDTGRGAPSPDMRGPGPGMNREMGPGMNRDTSPMMGRRGFDDDQDITGPRGDVGLCQERLARAGQLRLERVQRLVRPTDEQRAAFDELRMASVKAVNILREACPAERPLTPTARMAAAEKRLEARLQAIKTVRPALESFYRVLSDEQKMRWALGPRLEDRWGSGMREHWQGWHEPGWDRGGGNRRSDNDQPNLWRQDRPGQWREGWRGGQDGPGRGGDEYLDRWQRRWGDADRGDRNDRSSRDWPDQWRERWRDWHDRLGRDYGRELERWGQRWRGDDRWGERDFRDQDADSWRDQPRREERRRSTEPDEERL
jgi:hypothetical protein